jgi:hypothetical protein
MDYRKAVFHGLADKLQSTAPALRREAMLGEIFMGMELGQVPMPACTQFSKADALVLLSSICTFAHPALCLPKTSHSAPSPSHSTVTTVCPGPSSRAALTAPTQFIAALLPTNRPSLRRRYWACAAGRCQRGCACLGYTRMHWSAAGCQGRQGFGSQCLPHHLHRFLICALERSIHLRLSEVLGEPVDPNALCAPSRVVGSSSRKNGQDKPAVHARAVCEPTPAGSHAGLGLSMPHP